MPTKIQVKRSTTGGVVPTTGDLSIGELGINTADKKMFTSNGTAIFEVGSNVSSINVGGKFTANSTNAYVDGVTLVTTNTRSPVANNNTLIGTRSRINFIQGTNITLAITDDSGGNQVNVTISSTGGGGSTYTLSTLANTTAGANVRLSDTSNNNTEIKIVGTGTVNVQSNSTTITIDGVAGAAAAGGSNTHVQFNDSTVISGSAGFTFDKTSNNVFVANTITVGNSTVNAVIAQFYTDMPVANILTTATPANGEMRIVMLNGAKNRLALVDEWGEEDFMQSSMGQKSIAMVHAIPATATPSAFGVGIANTLAYVTRTPANTSLYLSTKRTGVASNTTAGTSAEHRSLFRYLWRGNTAGAGGFLFEVKFGIAAVSANWRFFCGLKDSGVVLANGNPSAQTNIIGVGIDSTQTTLRVMSNDDTGTATTIDLGANYPTNVGNTYIYLARFWCPPNASFVNYNVRRLDSDFSAQGSITTDLPQNTVFLAPKVWVNNGSDATVVGIDLMSWYSETTY